jgi:hypothetical protein
MNNNYYSHAPCSTINLYRPSRICSRSTHTLQRHQPLHPRSHGQLLPSYAMADEECPWTPSVYYAYPVTLTCETSCPSPYFAFAPNQTCLTTCPSTPNLTLYDYANRKCVSACPNNTYAASNQSCLACKSLSTQPVRRALGATPAPGCACRPAKWAATTPTSPFHSA